jgi:putative transposase
MCHTAGCTIGWVKYAGMTVSEARRLKELEQENAKLKRLLAEAELDKAALKDLLSRKW